MEVKDLKKEEDIKTFLEEYSITCVHMDDKRWYWVRVINNISVISWLSYKIYVMNNFQDKISLFNTK